MFNIGGQGQYFAGSIFAVWLGSSFLEHEPVAARAARASSSARSPGAVWAGIAGILKATVGAHEVISTIMLNWIAIWVGAYLFGQGGPLQGSQPSIPISNDIAEGAKLPVFWGLEAPAGPLDRHLHRARDARRLLDHHQPHDARLRGARGRVQPGGGALRRHLGARATTSSRWRSRARSPGSRARSTSPAGSTASARTTSTRTRSASSASPPRCSGATPRVGVGFASLLFGALINGTSGRQLDPSIFRPDLAGQPDDDHPGARHPLRRPEPRRRLGRWLRRRRRA